MEVISNLLMFIPEGVALAVPDKSVHLIDILTEGVRVFESKGVAIDPNVIDYY